MVVRTEGDSRALLPAVRAEVAAMDPEQPIYAVMTVDEAFATLMLPDKYEDYDLENARAYIEAIYAELQQ